MDQSVKIQHIGDFRKALVRAGEILDAFIEELPDFPPYYNMRNQIRAMSDWTAGSRIPSAEEKERIDVGLVAMRSISESPDRIAQELYDLLSELNYYFARM